MNKNEITPKYLRLTEEINALDYLEKFYFFLSQTNSDIMAWKWVIIALHGALYGFAICACKGSSFKNVLNKRIKRKNHLITFDKALELCQDTNFMHMKKPLKLTPQQNESVQKLSKLLRDEFVHYVPKNWSIEIHGFPQIVLDVLEIIEFLLINSGIWSSFNEIQKKKIKSIISQSKCIIENSTLYKEYKKLKTKD